MFNFCEKLKPEVRRFVNAQKRKEIITVKKMYIEQLRKEKRKPFKKTFKSV